MNVIFESKDNFLLARINSYFTNLEIVGKKDDQNIRINFIACYYLKIPDEFRGIRIVQASDEEWNALSDEFWRPLSTKNQTKYHEDYLYRLESEGNKFFIGASKVKIQKEK
jgi:hypothetical protein